MIVSDALLLAQLKQGDEDAFESLFRRHYDRVYRVLLNLLGSHDEAEDHLQETFLALYCQPPTIENQAELVAWLCRVALNRGYNALRGKQRALRRAQKVFSPITTQEDPHETVVRNQERERVRNTLATLAPRQSQLLLLRHTGYSYSEIATILNVSRGSIGTLLVRAERAFLQQYQEIALQQCESMRLLRAFLDEALPAAQTTMLRAHLLTCAECQHSLEDLRQLRAQVSARFVVQQPHQEVLNHMVNALLEQARELRISGKWQELAQLEQEDLPQEDVTSIERAELYALAANAYLHLGDKDAAQQHLLKFEEEQNALPAEHELHREFQALKATLDETTPEGKMWLANHEVPENFNENTIREKYLRIQEAAEQVLVSPTASLEQCCEARFFLLAYSKMRKQPDQEQLYLLQLEADLQQLPEKHYLRKQLQFHKALRSDRGNWIEKGAEILALVEDQQYEEALTRSEPLIQEKGPLAKLLGGVYLSRCKAYVGLISSCREQGNRAAAEQWLAKLKQEEQQYPEEFSSWFYDEIQKIRQSVTNELSPSPATRLLWQGEDLQKKRSSAEVIALIEPILEMEDATEKERREAYLLLGWAYVHLKQQEELQRLCDRFEEEMKNLPLRQRYGMRRYFMAMLATNWEEFRASENENPPVPQA